MKVLAAFFVALLVLVLLIGCTQGPTLPQNNSPNGMPFGQNPNGAYEPNQNIPDQNIPNQNMPGPDQNQPPQQAPLQGNPNGQPPKLIGGPSMGGVDPTAPLPTLPADVPKGEWITKNSGELEVKYFSTAIIRQMTESGTDYFITIKNNGSSTKNICFTTVTSELRSLLPSWNLHFFAMQDPPLALSAGEEKELWYYASIDMEQNSQNSFFKIPFSVGECNSPSQTINFEVTFGGTNENLWQNPKTTFIYGSVKDEEGNPIANAMVFFNMNCGRMDFKEPTDSSGNYSMSVFAMEDINAIYLGKKLACDSTDYFLSVEKENYQYYYNGHVAPTRKEPKEVNIVLKKSAPKQNYSLKWESPVQDNFGFFWVKPSSDWSVFAATQSKHPPELNKTTSFYLFSADGEVLWKQPTGNECWGIDIASDASKIVAGCHDGKVYAVDKAGTLLWKDDFKSMVRSACISNDNTKILSGDVPTLIDASTGAQQDLKWQGDWLRNCAFYSDDSGFVAGAREITGYDILGNQKWRQVIGEFPLFLSVDNSNNTYATGKSRTLFAISPTGALLWKHRIPDHTATAGASTPDGSRIALGTVGGMVYLFDKQGNLLWKRGTRPAPNASATGHNAIAISNDGKLILSGTAPQNCITAYDENGTIVWDYCATPSTADKDLLIGVTNIQISPDKKEIIASYGDNYIRKFWLS